MQSNSARRVIQTLWILTSCDSAAHLICDSLLSRKSSSDQSTSFMFLTMLPCFHSCSKPFASTSLQWFLKLTSVFLSGVFPSKKVSVPVPLNVNSLSSPSTVLSFYFTLFKAKDKMHHVSEDLLC